MNNESTSPNRRRTDSVEKRVAQLERRLLASELKTGDRWRAAIASIYRGTATSDDIKLVYEPEIVIIEQIIVLDARAIADKRRVGWNAVPRNTLDLAGAIASYPPALQPPEALLRQVVAATRTEVGASVVNNRHRGALRGQLPLVWLQGRIILAALGSPDGGRLRNRIASGEFDDLARVDHGVCGVPSAGFLSQFIGWVRCDPATADPDVLTDLIRTM